MAIAKLNKAKKQAHTKIPLKIRVKWWNTPIDKIFTLKYDD